MTRITIKAVWTTTPSHSADLPFHGPAPFIAIAKDRLQRCFQNYKAELKIDLAQNFHDEMYDFALEWTFDLDGVKGGYYDPKDHQRYMQVHLHEDLLAFSSRLKISEVLRHPEENDVDGATAPVAWDEGYRDRRYAAFVAKMEAEA